VPGGEQRQTPCLPALRERSVQAVRRWEARPPSQRAAHGSHAWVSVGKAWTLLGWKRADASCWGWPFGTPSPPGIKTKPTNPGEDGSGCGPAPHGPARRGARGLRGRPPHPASRTALVSRGRVQLQPSGERARRRKQGLSRSVSAVIPPGKINRGAAGERGCVCGRRRGLGSCGSRCGDSGSRNTCRGRGVPAWLSLSP